VAHACQLKLCGRLRLARLAWTKKSLQKYILKEKAEHSALICHTNYCGKNKIERLQSVLAWDIHNTLSPK
jgi:hypothetical protein